MRFPARTLPAKDAAGYFAKSMSAWEHRFEVRVTPHAPAEEIRRRFPPHRGPLEPIDERSCAHRTGDDHLDWLALRIAMFGGGLRRARAPELAERLRAMSRRLERAAGRVRSRP